MRYSAQRYGTWDWLELELPIRTDGPEWVLSSYGILEGTVAPDLGLQKAEDGRPVLEEWGTLIHAEVGEGASSRRWTGIVVRSELSGKDWNVSVREFPGYLDGTPIETTIWGVKADPAALFRKIVTDVQARPNSNLNITVSGSTTLRIGTDSDDKAAAAKKIRDADKKVVDARNKVKKDATAAQQKLSKAQSAELAPIRKSITAAQNEVNRLTKAKAPANQIAAARAVLTNLQTRSKNMREAHKPPLDALKKKTEAASKAKAEIDKVYEKSNEAYNKAKAKADEDGGAYKFMAEDTPDAHDSINTLCKDNALEWSTSTRYSTGAPNLTINVAYPTLGSRRDDLVFEQGVNVMSELVLVRDGEEYANSSIGIGAGEGAKAIRGYIAPSSARLRRTTVYEDKAIKTQSGLLAKMRADMKRRTGDPYVEEITVVDHEMAPMFSWNVGDHILVSGDVPHYGRYSKYHRILSWQLVDDHRAKLYLELST